MTGAVNDRAAVGVPQWIASSLHLTRGRDPIGLQTITIDRVMPRLVPAILALSRRARYFSYYPFLLLEYEERKLSPSNRALSGFIKAREYEFALAVQHCPRCKLMPSGVVGKQKAGPAANSGLDPLPRGESVESELGGYGLYYRTPLIGLGVAAPAGSTFGEDEATPVDIVNRGLGRELAESFREAIAGTDYYRQYMPGDEPIPRTVLEELATVACLCRLPEFPAEQALIRRALFDAFPTQTDGDVDQRRRSFATLLRIAQSAPDSISDEAAFRRAIWDAFQEHLEDGSRVAETLGQWAALVAKENAQDGLSTIWEATCRGGRRRADPDGMTADQLGQFIRDDLVGDGSLAVGGVAVSYEAGMPTLEFAKAVQAAASGVELEDLRARFTAEDSAVAGLALLLSVRDRVPDPQPAPRGWGEIGWQRSTWQPSVLQLMATLDAHMESHPTLADTIGWLVRQRVIAVHERIAYSKLPEFTFRFRWENDRLRFYQHFPAERFELTDTRRDAMARLSEDVGLWEREEDGAPRLTGVGEAFVDEVFA